MIMTIKMLGDVAEFQAPGQPRKKKSRLWGDVRTIADKGLYGAGGGLAVTALSPFKSKRVDKALTSQRLNKVPVFGKRIRNMALTVKPGGYLASNPAAMTTAGLVTGAAGLAYGANKVRQDRRRQRLAIARRR